MTIADGYHLFIDPVNGASLLCDTEEKKLISGDNYYSIEEGVIDFYNRLQLHPVEKSLVFTPVISSPAEQAPELRDAHEKAFEASESTGGNIYGDFASLPKITQSGHYRRMDILANIDLGNTENKVAVDFGTGPWGYGSIFPKLHTAKYCIGFDVSKTALLMARKATPDAIDKRTIYATSDGEFIPLKDDSVDIFFGGEVIEHVRNPFLFLQEVARICKQGATVILSTPNKDALHWKIFNQQYCVGPEHIALLSYDEFKKVLESFCKDIKIVGYETSLSHLMDPEPIDEDTLTKIQLRSEKYPQLSTGMISVSKIDKGLYFNNRKSLVLKETLWNSTDIYKPREAASLTLFSDIEGLLVDANITMHIPISGKYISLLFWGHDWSGIAEISCDKIKITKDLYSHAAGFIRVDITNNNFAKEVIIHNTNRKNIKSLSNQIIFYKVIEYLEKDTDTAAVTDSSNIKIDNLLTKHQRLDSALCCPNCHKSLSYPMADFLENIPIAGHIFCQGCGEVGKICNAKYLFTSSDLPKIVVKGHRHKGLLSVNTITFHPNMFLPKKSWELEASKVFSTKKHAKLALKCNSFCVSLVFLKHPWSGIARISVDGKEIGILDLFEEKGSMQIWYPIYLGGGDHLVECEVTGSKNPMSKDCQIILCGAETLEISSSSKSEIIYKSRNNGNAYPKFFDSLISNVPKEGLILDCGSGDRNHQDPRVISFEYSRFQSPDVFGDGHKLPFKDNSFDLVLSQAVIEHLYDPFTAVSEIYRVIKPGGIVYAESAFMQPLHAVPYHFFNTTAWGLEQLFKEFNILETKHEGVLSETFSWFYNLTALRQKNLGDKVDKLITIAKELDTHITNEELKSFSSYVTILAEKPRLSSAHAEEIN